MTTLRLPCRETPAVLEIIRAIVTPKPNLMRLLIGPRPGPIVCGRSRGKTGLGKG